MHTIYFLYELLNADRSDTYYYITFAWVILYLLETLNYSINHGTVLVLGYLCLSCLIGLILGVYFQHISNCSDVRFK